MNSEPVNAYGISYEAATSGDRNLLSLRALLTTVSDESPMAAAAKMGFSSIPKKGKSTPAATGIRMVLYAKAQKRFCFISELGDF